MIYDLVNRHGTESQRERLAANRLPESELRDIAGSILFQPLNGFTRYRRMKLGDVDHESYCRGRSDAVVIFKVGNSYQGSLTESQWDIWKLLEDTLQKLQLGIATTNIRQHIAECLYCTAAKYRLSVLVSISFEGMILSREYAL